MSGREDFSFIGRISKAKKKLVFGRGMSVNVFSLRSASSQERSSVRVCMLRQ